MNGSELTPFALAFMSVSMVSVTALVLYCFVRILRGGRSLRGESGADGE